MTYDELAIEALSLSRQPEFMAYLDGIATGMRNRPEEDVTLNDLRKELNLSKPVPRCTQKVASIPREVESTTDCTDFTDELGSPCNPRNPW